MATSGNNDDNGDGAKGYDDDGDDTMATARRATKLTMMATAGRATATMATAQRATKLTMMATGRDAASLLPTANAGAGRAIFATTAGATTTPPPPPPPTRTTMPTYAGAAPGEERGAIRTD